MAGRSVILYSGGMDSFCLSRIQKNHNYDLLFIDIGTEDNKKEKKKLPTNVQIISLPLNQWELSNKIIPFRNCFFVLIAAQWYSDIYIGATVGDTTKDKDYVFKGMMESMLNYFGLDMDKIGHQSRPFIIHMPFKSLTKTEILAAYLHEGNSIEDFVHESRSCYSGSNDQECGECRSCLRKYIAMINNKVDHVANFITKPTIQQLKSFLDESIKKNRHREIDEIKRAIRR